MKKKILIILIAIISLSGLSTVYADDCAKSSPRLSLLAANNEYDTEINIYYYSSGSMESATKGRMRIQKLNGYWALCLHLGWHSNSSLSFSPTRLNNITLNTIEKLHYLKAYKYVTDNAAGDEELSYIVAQIAVWISSLSSNGGVPTVMLRKSVTSAYCAIRSNYYAKLGCADGEAGFKYTASTYSSIILEATNKYSTSGSYDASKLAIWYSNDISNVQPLLSRYVCNPTCESTNSCATAAEQNVDRTESGACNYSHGYDSSTTVIPTSCSSGTSSGFINDINDWGCIFNSTSASSPVNTRYIEDNSNSYCNVFCREQIISTFPTSVISVLQGKYVTVGSSLGTGSNISPIIYDGVKNCRPTVGSTGTINVAQFLRDLDNINNQIPGKWNSTQAAYLNWLAANNATLVSETRSNICKTTVDWWQSDKDSCVNSVNSSQGSLLAQHRANNPDDKRSDAELWPAIYAAQYSSCINSKSKHCGGENYNDYYKDYVYRGSASNGAYGSTTITMSFNERDSNIGSQKNAYYSTYIQRLNDYNSAVNQRDALIAKINSCTTMASGIRYNEFNPDLTFKYEEPIYGNMGTTGWSLKKTLSEIKTINYYKGGSAVSGTSTYATSNINDGSLRTNKLVYVCGTNGSTCGTQYRSYYNTTWWELFYNKQYSYQLSDGIYRYIEKGSGQSVHTKANPDLEYIDVGFSNLPIHYSTKPGNYDYAITTNTYGPNNRFNAYVSLPNVYTCQYNVSCNNTIQNNSIEEYERTCPSATTGVTGSGLNVVYRTISLNSKKEAFPGISGTGRTPGANWNNDTLINTYIVNNRGVANYEVYHLDPLYEIELTPAVMKVIRAYNKKQNSKTITMYSGTSASKFGIAGYSDFSNMTCRSNGTRCVSSLLRGNVTGYTAIKVTGCAISGSGSYTRCGSGNQAW